MCISRLEVLSARMASSMYVVLDYLKEMIEVKYFEKKQYERLC